MLLTNADHVTQRAKYSGGKFCHVCRGLFGSDSHPVDFIGTLGKVELNLGWPCTVQP